MAVTPGREVWLEVDGPAYSTVLRPTYQQNWSTNEMGRSDSWVRKVNVDLTLERVDGNQNTIPIPGGGWALAPFNQYKTGKFSIVSGTFPSAIPPVSGFTVAPNIKTQNMYRPPTDLTGVGGGSFSTVTPALRKRVPAGQAWDHADNRLAADEAAYPPPVDADFPASLPVDRVLKSAASYEPNMGFAITFGMQTPFYGAPMFMRLYFGGSTPMEPSGTYGGEFCLCLYGGGQAVLYERDLVAAPATYTWRRRWVFRWAEADSIVGGSHTLIIWPVARDRILFYTRITDQPAGPGGLILPPLAGERHSDLTTNVYWDTAGQTGHYHQQATTGSGPLRIDILRNYRFPWYPWLVMFPATGYLIDQPFTLPLPVMAGMPISIGVDGFSSLGTGTALQVALYNATTGTILTQDVAGNYLAHQGEQKYYALFNFTASTNQYQTPILAGYQVYVAPDIVVRTKTPVSGKVRDGSVTGPDMMPGHGSANVNIRDRNGVFTILRAHDRRYCRLSVKVPTTGPSGDPRGYVVLHQGETWQPRAQLRGREGLGNKQWFDYNLNMIDMWLRVQKQQPYWTFSYSQDFDAPDPGSPGKFFPWAVMAIIRDLLHRTGFPYDEIDTPGYDAPGAMRLGYSPNLTTDDYLVHPGTDLSRLIHRLANDFLGMCVIRDPNAFNETNDDRGMWRVIAPPAGTEPIVAGGEVTYDLDNSKAIFFVRRPAALADPETPFVVEDEGALTAGGLTGAFVKDESYILYPQAPEGTYLEVRGTGSLQPGGADNQSLWAYNWNPKAVDYNALAPTADPDSISFMDRFEPIFVDDNTYTNQDSVNWAATRIARQALVGRLWCEFTAPLILIQDPTDDLLGARRRPLRVYDQVTVVDEHGNPHPVMLRNVNPFWTSSRIMWMHCQGLFLDAR